MKTTTYVVLEWDELEDPVVLQYIPIFDKWSDGLNLVQAKVAIAKCLNSNGKDEDGNDGVGTNQGWISKGQCQEMSKM